MFLATLHKLYFPTSIFFTKLFLNHVSTLHQSRFTEEGKKFECFKQCRPSSQLFKVFTLVSLPTVHTHHSHLYMCVQWNMYFSV
jgi:hypothetical protein